MAPSKPYYINSKIVPLTPSNLIIGETANDEGIEFVEAVRASRIFHVVIARSNKILC